MKKGDIIEGIIERTDFPGKGVMKAGDRYIAVKNALTGQKVRVRVAKLRKGKAEGTLLEVLEKSPLETETPCPHFGACGGCVYQGLSYEKQIRIKEDQVRRLLDSVLAGNVAEDEEKLADSVIKDRNQERGPEYVFEGIRESPAQFCYRNKMEFTFGDEIKDGPLALGMHRRGSFYDIVTVDGCRIVDEDYRKILRYTLGFFSELGTPYYHRMRHEGYLRHLLVRKGAGTGEILVGLVTTTQLSSDDGVLSPQGLTADAGETRAVPLEKLTEGLLSLALEGEITGILHILNDSPADAVKSDRTVVLYGREFFYEKLLGLTFQISPFSFFQTNSAGAEVLYRTVREYAGADARAGLGETDGTAGTGPGPGRLVYDLYSGTGTIAQILAPVVSKVVGVEIVEEAVKAARENAAENGLHNCEFIAGDVLKVLDEIEERPDLIILDPPRDGIHPKALGKILAYGADQMVYVSCKPTSLVRDLKVILESGYRVKKACAVDMFAWTGGIETVALLCRVR